MASEGQGRTGATGSPLARRLAGKRLAARIILYAEALIPLLLPVLLVVAGFLALVWFGYFRHAPFWLHVATLLAAALGLIALLLRLRGIVRPSIDDADRMLEARNALAHQAIRVQDDRPAGEDAFAGALWREHQVRMARMIGALRTGTPEPDIARHDRHGLRAVPVLLAVIAFAFSYSNHGGLLADVVSFRASGEAAPDVRIDAWVTPPAHTSKAPVFLTGNGQDQPAGIASEEIRIPQFSELTVRVTGGSGDEQVTYQAAGEDTATAIRPGAEQPKDTKAGVKAPADGVRTMQYKIMKDGTLTVDGRTWIFSVIPERVPEIAFNGIPKATVTGALEIGFIAKDDYGLQEAHAEIVPVDQPGDARPLYPLPEYRLDLPRRAAREAKGTTSRNLSEHPLSGKRVKITLVARDAAGQEGRSQPVEMVLPAKTFFEPLAAAVAEERQVFALDANQLPQAIALNEALTIRPEETIPNLTHYLLLQSANARMKLARTDDQMRETADYLWEIALGIEDGNLSLADRRLREAQKALSEALERNASDEEVAKLMKELREAMQAYMEELARQAAKNGQQQSAQQQGRVLRQQDLQRMMDQIENLARSGARDQAQQMLSDLQRMMNNLQAGRPQQGQGQQNDAMRQQMDKLGALVQEQQRLMEQTFQFDQALRDRQERGDPMPGEDGEQAERQPGDNGGDRPPTDQMTAEQLRDALKKLQAQQDALGKQLGELNEALKGMGLDPGEGFGKAGREMKGASQALGEGEGESAVGSQGRALEALRQGAQSMMNQMQAMGQGQGQGMPQAGRQGRDPLGRETRAGKNQGPDTGGPEAIPEEFDIQRARDILEEIRRKLGAGATPGLERDYLERLLGIH